MSAINVAYPSHVIGFCVVMRMGYVVGTPGTSPTVRLPELRSAASSEAGPWRIGPIPSAVTEATVPM
jgi:hypothetical protein